MPILDARVLAGALLLLGCATARPIAELDFRGLGRANHDKWMQTLQNRYGCDTTALRSIAVPVGYSPGQPSTIDMGPDPQGRRIIAVNPNASRPTRNVPPVGSTPCQLAFTYPTSVRVWPTQEGIREDWMRGTVVAYRFEGPSPPAVRLTVALVR